MSGFDERKDAYENKFAHDAELKFKSEARRNKKLGLWLADAMGKSGDDADAYAKTVIMSDFDEPGDDDVVRKVMADIAASNLGISEDDVKVKMSQFLIEAAEEIENGA